MLDYMGRYTWKPVTIANGATVSGDIDAVQQAYNDATSGTFRFKFRGQETDALDYDASAAEVKTALQGLQGINTVTVTGVGTSGDPWIITFTDPGSERLEPLGADNSSLSAGAATTVTVTTPGEGPIDILGYEVVAIGMPAALSNDGSTEMTFQVDPGDGTFRELQDDSTAPLTLTNITAGDIAQVEEGKPPICGVKLTLTLSVAESADREFLVMLKLLH